MKQHLQPVATKYFYHSGKIGDIIYSLPTVQALSAPGDWVIFVTGLPPKAHAALAPLLLWQPRIDGVLHIDQTELPIGYTNLDYFRLSPLAGAHLVIKHLKEHTLHDYNWNKPWLHITTPLPMKGIFAVISVTDRYRDRFFNWNRELNKLAEHTDTIYFLGDKDEYNDFAKKYARKELHYYPTCDFWQAAQLIAQATYFSGNQSSMLAIRQGLALPYRLEQSPNHTDCNQYSENETVLNPLTRKLHLFISNLKKLMK